MLANWVKESVDSAPGTGTIDLGGAATGFVAFSDQFSDGDVVHYSVVDGNDREIGIGTFSTGSPDTLSRDTVLETLDSGTFDNSSPSALDLSASAEVTVAPSVYTTMARNIITSQASGRFFLPHNYGSYESNGKGGGEFTSSSGRIQYCPAVFLFPVKISEVGCDIQTLSAGGNFRLALYTSTPAGKPDALLFDSGDMSTASETLVSTTLSSPIWVFPGLYFMADAVDNTTAEGRGARAGNSPFAWAASNISTPDNGMIYWRENQTYGAFPSTATPVEGVGWASFGSVYR